MNAAQDLKDWVESLVDAVEPKLGLESRTKRGDAYKVFAVGGKGELVKEEDVISFFKHVFLKYVNDVPSPTKLYWRAYPTIEHEFDSIEIRARLVVVTELKE